MAWVLGIDEAGYGPNLGPFVMSAVACRLPDERTGGCLWSLLAPAVRRGGDKKDDRVLVDDSKVVYAGARGLAGLERGVFALLGLPALSLGELIDRLCPDDRPELAREAWFRGDGLLPGDVDLAALAGPCGRFAEACRQAEVGDWVVQSAVVCPGRFNAVVEQAGSKGAVLADSFMRLLRAGAAQTAGPEPLTVFIDKQGGRNTYAAQVQHALPGSVVLAVEESMQRSHYQVHGLGRDVRLTFQPRADAEHFCVALASMVSKYLRELLMAEFNRFWQNHVPGLAPTAGYPGDAPRFLEAIRAAAATLKIPEREIWRQR
jgi:ribonuclease HII